MHRFVAMLLAVPLLAAAQAEPLTGAAPPAPVAPAATPAAGPPPIPGPAPTATPCPPLSAAVLPPSRGGWYLGLGLGGGSGQAQDSFGKLALHRWVDQDPLTLFGQIEAGITLTPHLLLGGELSLLRTNSDTGAMAKAVTITNLDAMATWFPMEKGVFLRGGGGLSSFTREWTGLPSGRYNGGNLTVGAGYAFWLGPSFNLVLHADVSKQWYGANAIALTSSSYTAFWLGVAWY
jgi:hypothetical protein